MLTLTGSVGASINSTISILPMYGFTGTVQLTVSATPGLTCSLNTRTISGTDEAKLSVQDRRRRNLLDYHNRPERGISKSIDEVYTVNHVPHQSSPAPGLGLGLTYVLIGGIVTGITALAITAVVVRGKRSKSASVSLG